MSHKFRSTLLSTAILAVLVAALAIAPPAMAKGGTVRYQGPVNEPFVPSNTGFPRQVPSIEMKVVFRGKIPSSVPDGVVPAQGLYGPCLESNGCTVVCLDFNGVCDPPQCFDNTGVTNTTGNTVNHAFKVRRNRTFAGTYFGQFDTPAEQQGNFMTLTGKVHKRSVTGTVRFHTYRPARVGSDFNPRPAETCDSGVLTYTASR